MTEFEYRLQEELLVLWTVTVSGYDDIDDINGECDSQDTLADVEILMENFENEYCDHTGASLVRVHGAHGWRIRMDQRRGPPLRVEPLRAGLAMPPLRQPRQRSVHGHRQALG